MVVGDLEVMYEQLERETKWDVDDDFVLPPLDSVLPGTEVDSEAIDVESVYYDTADFDLRAHGIVVRNRAGDDDTGWQVKLPTADGRLELHWPASESMPVELSRVLAGASLGRPLHDVTTIRTHRRRHLVLRAGTLAFELADDDVRAFHGSSLLAWREIEVELGPAVTSVPAPLQKQLRKAGARRPAYPSKLAHATGITMPAGRWPKAPRAVVEYLDEQINQVVLGDVQLRCGNDPIHDTRVAIRRIRSTLRVFAQRLDPGTAAIDEELKWFAGVLGRVRDAQVQQRRFADALDGMDAEVILGPVHSRIRNHLQGVELPARAAVDDAMLTERYLTILTMLRRWRTDPPISAETTVDAVRQDARRASKKARRRLRRALEHDDPDLLHSARKAAKRARYAAELVAPIDPTAKQRAKEHKHVQTMLGEHQDAVVAMEILRRLGATAGTSSGENGFTFGILYAREQSIAAQCRAEAHRLV